MPWQCSFAKLCSFAPIMPTIMRAQSPKAYAVLTHGGSRTFVEIRGGSRTGSTQSRPTVAQWAFAKILQRSNFRPTRPSFPPFGHSANFRQVLLLLFIGDYVVVVRQLNGFLRAGATWRYRLATRRCKFWFCNLARVGVPFGLACEPSFRREIRLCSQATLVQAFICERLHARIQFIRLFYWISQH